MWFEFITNTDCNWKCSYCAFDKVEDVRMTKESIDRHQYIYDFMKQVEDKTIVVEGGEIGLIGDNDLLEYLFDKFDQKVIVNTNGKFFEQDRTQLYPYIDKVFYHVAPDTNTVFRVEPLDVPLEVIYGIVDRDEEDINRFIQHNKHLDFGYVGYETNYIDEEKEIPEIFHKRLMCSTMNPFVSIDLSREVLCMCTTRGCHITIPLTDINFKRVLTNYTNFKEHNDMCDTCYRNCKSNTFDGITNNKKVMRKVYEKNNI